MLFTQQTRSTTLGLSGGVDSSVAALLLKKAGYDVHPVFMRNWQGDGCPYEEDFKRASDVAYQMGLTVQWVDGSALYYEQVFKKFIIALQAGYTPNPDIWCNEFVKFDLLVESADPESSIATGHYARIQYENGHHALYRAKDLNKDQSYFLSRINPALLPRLLFPLGDYTKKEVRAIAGEHGLVTASQKESMGICFIGPDNYTQFIKNHVVTRKGPIITDTGQTIGEHHGLLYYTLGQRKGLGVGGVKNHPEAPWYVIDKLLDTHTLVLSQNPEHPLLMRTACTLIDMHWFGSIPRDTDILLGQVRHRQKAIHCSIKEHNNHYTVHFTSPPWALTPGQHVVLYQGDRVIGSGIIHTLGGQ